MRHEHLRLGHSVAPTVFVASEVFAVGPEGLAIAPPIEPQRPPRQAFTRIPLPLPEVEQAAGREPLFEAVNQGSGPLLFAGPNGSRVPLFIVEIVDAHERGLATHRQADVARGEIAVHHLPNRVDCRPLRGRIGPCGSWLLPNPGHAHRVREVDFARLDQPADRRCRGRIGGRGQRDVALTRQHPGRGIEPHPAGTGQVDLGPGVEIGEVGGGACRSFQRLLVRHKLDEIS